MNVFLDTNVIIDFMGEREGFFDNAAAIFAMIEDIRHKNIIKNNNEEKTV